MTFRAFGSSQVAPGAVPDQTSLHVVAKQEFLDVQAGHDGLAGAGGLDAPALHLTGEECADVIHRLGGEIYNQWIVRKYVLIRLDELLSDPQASRHEPKVITVEHVLPQSPRAGSEWVRLFTPEQRAHWTHRLANLVLLSRTKNSEAKNYEFAVKKARYFTSRSGVSNFPLTTQVLATESWTPELLDRRQRELIDVLSRAWQLGDRHAAP